MILPHAIYCDGGVIGPNPSKEGGTWSWCWIDQDDRLLQMAQGIITVPAMGAEAITNNQTELLAALLALESVPKEWNGTLFTDSMVTLYRITESQSFNGTPQWLRMRVLERRRARRYRVRLVKGHSNLKDIASGTNAKGQLTSKWNRLCDRTCTDLARIYKERGK